MNTISKRLEGMNINETSGDHAHLVEAALPGGQESGDEASSDHPALGASCCGRAKISRSGRRRRKEKVLHEHLGGEEKGSGGGYGFQFNGHTLLIGGTCAVTIVASPN
jgi:hypothetical protein